MHTDNHTQADGSSDPEGPDAQLAQISHRGPATEERRAAPPHTRPLSDTRGSLPLCAHGMNSLAESGYDLALARLRRG